jgi:hypothetical protein
VGMSGSVGTTLSAIITTSDWVHPAQKACSAAQQGGALRTWSIATVRGREQVGHCTAPSAAALSMNSRMQPRQKVWPHPAVTGSCRFGSCIACQCQDAPCI